jgi:cytosine/adenosine deaminase-related metal-dependent hydrolase
MFAELQAGWFRAQEAHVGWSPERWLQALTSGARLASDKLGIPLGQIAAGAGADLVVLDPPPGPEIHAGNTASTFLFRLSSAAVRHVMVAGEFRLVDRCPSGVDAADVQARAATAARAIWARMV